jgi:hypothetical protein
VNSGTFLASALEALTLWIRTWLFALSTTALSIGNNRTLRICLGPVVLTSQKWRSSVVFQTWNGENNRLLALRA